MAPPNSKSFSVSVVFPASGWEMMAKVRRRATGSRSFMPMLRRNGSEMSTARPIHSQLFGGGAHLDLLMRRNLPLRLAAIVIARDQRVDGRRHEKRENRADAHPRRDDDPDREAALRPSAHGDDQWNHPGHHGGGGHQNRAQTHGRGMFNRLAAAKPLLVLQPVGELNHEDPMFGDQTNQGDEADLRINIHTRHAKDAENV